MAKRVARSGKELRRKLERAESGDANSAKELNQAERSDPATTEAVEQEASDGPGGRGLDR